MCVPPELIDLNLKEIDTVAVDLETYDPDLKNKGSGAVRESGYVCGIAVATGKQTMYFPIRHAMTGNLPPKKTWEKLNKILFQNRNIKKVFHNAMYDVCWIRKESGLMPQGPLLDTMVAASVIDENRMKYSLDALSKDYLKDSKYKYDLQEKALTEYGIKSPMTNMHKLPYSLVKEYAEQDVNLTLRLWKLFDIELSKERKVEAGTEDEKAKNLRHIFELETELFPCLVDMKFKGVKINVEAAKKLGQRLRRTKNNIINYIQRRTGIKIEIWAASSIKKLLDKLKIKDYKTTPKSKLPQLPKNYLKTHANHFLRMIAEARELDKAEGTFVESLLGFVHKGRIHADINQIRGEKGGTVTGRFSMSNPNLQQIPAKGFIGKKMRELFIPEEGHTWGSFDYSQQEPRIVVHYALKLGLQGTEDVVNAYNEKPDADFHQIVADMAKIPRITAKTINLGLFYGMGKNKLANQLDLDLTEAKELFDTYHAKVPFVKKLSYDLQEFARRNKFLYTLEDRFCRFDKWEPRDKRWDSKKKVFFINQKEWDEEKKDFVWKEVSVPLLSEEDAKLRYKAELLDKGYPNDSQFINFQNNYQPAFIYRALNKLVQGSAADMTKKAMVLLYREGIVPHIQIHDELCISITGKDQAKKIKDIMEKAIRLEIPNKVDYESGPNWGSIKPG